MCAPLFSMVVFEPLLEPKISPLGKEVLWCGGDSKKMELDNNATVFPKNPENVRHI